MSCYGNIYTWKTACIQRGIWVPALILHDLFLFVMSLQPAVLDLTDEISSYMKASLAARGLENAAPISHPEEWDIHLLTDCQLAVRVISDARKNQSMYLRKF